MAARRAHRRGGRNVGAPISSQSSGFSATHVGHLERFLALVGLLYGGLYLIHAAAPEISPDGVAYHLGLVRRYYGAHGFPAITTNIYAYLSQGAEMLYLFAYAVGRHSAAKLVHLSFLVGGVGAILLLARRFRCWPAG